MTYDDRRPYDERVGYDDRQPHDPRDYDERQDDRGSHEDPAPAQPGVLVVLVAVGAPRDWLLGVLCILLFLRYLRVPRRARLGAECGLTHTDLSHRLHALAAR